MCKHVLCHALQFHHNRFYILPIYIATETVHKLLARGRFPGKKFFCGGWGGGVIKTELGSFDTFCKQIYQALQLLILHYICILCVFC